MQMQAINGNNQGRQRYFVFFMFLFLFSACSGGSGSSSATSSGTGSLAFSVELTDATGKESPMVAAQAQETIGLDCEDTGITTVVAQVYDENKILLAAGGPWACDLHAGTIEGVAAGANRQVVIICWNGEDLVFRGEAAPTTVVAGETTDVGTVAVIRFAPVLLRPEDNAVFTGTAIEQGAVTFEYSPVPGASSYQIKVAADFGFTSLVIEEIIEIAAYTPMVLLPTGTYYWQVRAVDSYGNPGYWPEEPWRFIVILPLSVSLRAEPSELMPGGTSTLTAVVKNADGRGVEDGTIVNFSATAGILSAASAATTDGVASVQLTGSEADDVVTITAAIGEVSDSTTVTFAGIDSGHITYSHEGQVYRIKAEDGATPENISLALDSLSSQPPGGQDLKLNISPDGNWLVLETERFDEDCYGWACLAIVAADLSTGDVVRSSDGVVHPEGFPAIASGGNLIVYPKYDGTHTIDLWAVSRASSSDDWRVPIEITTASTYEKNSLPAISDDGRKVLFNCTDEPFSGQTCICEVGVDGTGFRVVLTPADSPDGFPDTGDLHSPDYAPDGSIVFEADWDGEHIWRLPGGATEPVRITTAFNNDNSPCVLPDGSIASLWLDRPEGVGVSELKVMKPDGSSYFMLLTDIDIWDIGMGSGN